MTTSDTELYDTLGVDPKAPEEEIRRAYRKLAREHHPDLNPGKPEAEEKFKSISAAYEILANNEKRALYDEFGKEALRGGFDPEQARAYERWAAANHHSRARPGEEVPYEFDLSDLLGVTRTRGNRGVPYPLNGEDLFATVELDFAAALHGTEVELQVPSRAPCEECAGSGASPNSQPKPCSICDGSGRTQVVRGPMRMMVGCSACGGTGHVREPCVRCHGAGYLTTQQSLRVRIPAGADNDDELRVRGKGTPGLIGGEPGDVVVRTHIKPHPFFQRDGLDLRLKLPVTLAEAQRGASVSVPTPTGPVQLKLPARTKQGTQLRLKSKGVHRGTARGDLYVTVDIRPPESDDPALAELLLQTERFYEHDLRRGIEL